MSPESFSRVPAQKSTADTSPEEMPTEYYAREIFKLNRDIDEAEKEKALLLKMSGHFTDHQSLSPEKLTEFKEQFGALRRFQTGNIDPERYVTMLANDALTAGEENSPFGAQIDALTSDQIEWHDELTEMKRQQAEDRST